MEEKHKQIGSGRERFKFRLKKHFPAQQKETKQIPQYYQTQLPFDPVPEPAQPVKERQSRFGKRKR